MLFLSAPKYKMRILILIFQWSQNINFYIIQLTFRRKVRIIASKWWRISEWMIQSGMWDDNRKGNQKAKDLSFLSLRIFIKHQPEIIETHIKCFNQLRHIQKGTTYLNHDQINEYQQKSSARLWLVPTELAMLERISAPKYRQSQARPVRAISDKGAAFSQYWSSIWIVW